MTDILKELIKGKKVLILGFGREGKSTLKMLIKAGGYKSLAIADQNQVILDDEFKNENIMLICNAKYQNAMDESDVVFKSPGIVLNKAYDEYKCEIVSQTEIFFRRYKKQIIGITGTKGKSTVTTLIYHILKSAGVKVVLAGNIGIPVFDIAKDMAEDTIAVVELSCHQLEYMTVSPHIGVLLNIYEEHLDHYGTMEKYIASKHKIYENQAEGDILICNIENKPLKCNADVITAGFKGINKPDIEIINEKKPVIHTQISDYHIPAEEIQLIGEHNYYNIAIAYAVCKRLNISEEVFSEALKTYETLPHRLQYVATVDGIKYYDDSISTACETTIQAICSLKDADTVLIGGMDRGINYEKLEEFLSTSNVNNIILMEATGKRIFKEITEDMKDFARPERLHVVEHLDDAVLLAKKITGRGKSCIMSPAAASYGIFKNFEDRGNYFAKIIKE